MSQPSDTLLPANAKYFGFIDSNYSFNPKYEVSWSFTYALTGTEHGICTFLTTNDTISGYGGHYLGYNGTTNLSAYVLEEGGELLLDEGDERILLEEADGTDRGGFLAIAMDTTGLFALSSTSRGGVGLGNVLPNSLIIKDSLDNLVVYEELSNIDPNFDFTDENYKTLRFRYSRGGNKLSIEYKPENINEFITLTSIDVDLKLSDYDNCNVGFSFCSPISSASTNVSTLLLKNFHVQGLSFEETTEYSSFTPLTSQRYNAFTTLTGISATPTPEN